MSIEVRIEVMLFDVRMAVLKAILAGDFLVRQIRILIPPTGSSAVGFAIPLASVKTLFTSHEVRRRFLKLFLYRRMSFE